MLKSDVTTLAPSGAECRFESFLPSVLASASDARPGAATLLAKVAKVVDANARLPAHWEGECTDVIRGGRIHQGTALAQVISAAVRPLREHGVQQEVGSPQHADEGPSDAEPCEACDVARSGVAGGTGSSLADATVTVGTDVVVISGPPIGGQLIVPRQHIGGLEELSLPQRAQVLAAIRRATAAVGAGEHEPAPRVLVSTDSPASASHVCFLVARSDDAAPRGRLP
jgi:hypothetical protein